MRYVKLKPMGMSFADSSDSTPAMLSDVGNYRVRISPITDKHGAKVEGDIMFFKGIDASGRTCATATLDLETVPAGIRQSYRYHGCAGKNYPYTLAGIRQILEDITGEPCDVKVMEA